LSVEEVFSSVASGLKLIAEMSSVALIAVGLVVALYFLVSALITKEKRQYIRLRLSLGRFLVVALELQLAADIISTAISPSWEQIGQLAAIALIRTFLNHFLNKEIEAEEKEKRETEMTQSQTNMKM
jgi:uncharacterized membrane protein